MVCQAGKSEGSREMRRERKALSRLGFYVAAGSKEENRKTSLHAHESGPARPGRSPKGLAAKQLFVRLEIHTGLGPNRPTPLKPNRKPRPFENHEESATRKFNVKGFAIRPRNAFASKPSAKGWATRPEIQRQRLRRPAPKRFRLKTFSERVGHPRLEVR